MARQNMEDWNKKLEGWSKKFPEFVLKAYREMGPVIVQDVRSKRLSGQVLGVRTGNLRSSIRHIISKTPRPSLKIGTDVNYGAIWMRRGRDFIRPSIRAKSKLLEKAILDQIINGYKRE